MSSVFPLLLLILGCGTPDPPPNEVIDVTQLVRVPVDRIAKPHTAAEVQRLVREHRGPISIGGGRFSMGGQVASESTLHLDMREMDDVLDFWPEENRIRLEAGATWHDMMVHIDPHDKAPRIMQSYANFTVGGSMSVNAHGRYVNQGPLVHAVESFRMVLADGTLVDCSREENSDLFFGAIGGYGALGVIVDATLLLDENTKISRTHEFMELGEYRQWFLDNIETSTEAVYHNADLYPPNYDRLVAITYDRTDAEPTVDDRLQEQRSSTFVERTLYWAVMDLPYGKKFRSDVYDPWRLGSEHVIWRNFEASYDARTLEPASREDFTYVLQEYFVPVDRLEDFVPVMAEIFNRYQVDIANVSIRHASADPDTLMSWAPVETYAFVVYYKQKTAPWARTEVGLWTRELIDAVNEVEGTYYLPYQPHATEAQFHRSYPRANELFALKFRVDPDYRFRNKLWDKYLPPWKTGWEESDAAIAEKLAARDDWQRPEDQTFLTLPEWYIVYSADELGAHLASNQPSSFQFFASIGQFWTLYDRVSDSIGSRYPFNQQYHGMIWVIGVSYTVEYAVKGLWEHTVGRATEWWDGGGVQGTPKEQFIGQLAVDYGAFIHHTPWYAYHWWQKKADLAAIPKGWTMRRFERRFVTWVELGAKAIWADALGAATASTYAPQATEVYAWVRKGEADPTEVDGVSVAESLGEYDQLLAIPRYEPFTTAVPALAERGVEFVRIAGNDRLLVQVIAPDGWDEARLYGPVLHEWPILTQPGKKRVAIEIPVVDLHLILPALDVAPVEIEHLYDY